MRYPGSSDALASEKRAAQFRLYHLHAKRAPHNGHAVALIGTDPKNTVTLMRDHAHWPGERVWLVDYAQKAAVTKARRLWPTANARHENVLDTLRRIGPIGFADLDFMGFVTNPTMREAIAITLPKLLPRAAVSITWYAARDQVVDRLAAARDIVHDAAVATGVVMGNVLAYTYQHGHSPMGMAAWCRIA